MARLVEIGAPRAGTEYPVSTAECVIGRAPDCDVAVQDQRVSRHHARLLHDPEGLRVEDLGSANGTYLNGRRIMGQVLVGDGDEIALGSARFRVELAERGDGASGGRVDGRVTIAPPGGRADPIIEVANLRHDESLRDALRTKTQPIAARDLDVVREVERLQHKLRTMYRVGDAVASSLEPRALLDRVVELLLDVFPQARSAAAVVRDPRAADLRTVAFRCREGAEAPRETVLPAAVADRVLRQGHSVLLRSALDSMAGPGDGGRVTAITPIPGVGSMALTGWRMGAPLSYRGEQLGILHVEAAPDAEGFTQADLDLLGGIAAQAGVALHVSNLHERQRVRDRLEKDLVIARQIQRNLLPREPPKVTGMDVAVHYEPAFHVGGDFYDFLWFGPNHLGIVVGDVSGKAISGALFMARVASEIRANAMLEPDPRRLLERVNRAIAQVAEDGMFCTAVVLSIDLERQLMRVANAGHTVPLLRRNGRVMAIDDPEARTLPLGVEPHIHAGEVLVELAPGDSLLVYTDGLVEARGSSGDLYGAERLEQAFRTAPRPCRAALDALLGDLDRFVADAPQADDQTIVALDVTGPSLARCVTSFPPAL